MARMESYPINLRPDQIEALRALCKGTNVPISVHVREAIDRYLPNPIKGTAEERAEESKVS